MLVAFTGCKKKLATISKPNSTAKSVYITLNSGDDSKVVVTPVFEDPETHQIYAKVEFEDGDKIYVGNNGKYCGYLEYDDETHNFRGTVAPESENDYLHFYFMGNKTPSASLETNTTTAFYVNITDQTSKYPVISYARSTKLYKSGLTSYSAKLQNYCAIVKFLITNVNDGYIPASNAISITGMNNIVAVNFDANNYATSTTGNPYVFSKYGEGDITLHPEDEVGYVRWAILVPQSKVNKAQASGAGCFTLSENDFTVPIILANQYKPDGISIKLHQPEAKAFCVNKNYAQVTFAPGNLKLTRANTSVDWSTGTWSFMANQHDYSPTVTTNVAENYATSTEISHFGWGTSGYDINADPDATSDSYATNYQPYCTTKAIHNTSPDDNHPLNPYHYGPSWTSTEAGNGVHIAGTKFDWAVYHAIYNPITQETDPAGTWRTISSAEMKFILGPNISVAPTYYGNNPNTRRSATVNGVPNARFAKAYLFGTIHGLIIFPDGYVHPDGVPGPEYINVMNDKAAWNANKYTVPQWNAMQVAGAVFLPAAGSRDYTSISSVGSSLFYWTSSYNNYQTPGSTENRAEYACNVRIDDDEVISESRTQRYRGCTIRLVKDVE